jgi:hypothetical protein
LCHLMEEGIENLSPPEKRSLLSRPETLARLHFLLVSQRP